LGQDRHRGQFGRLFHGSAAARASFHLIGKSPRSFKPLACRLLLCLPSLRASFSPANHASRTDGTRALPVRPQAVPTYRGMPDRTLADSVRWHAKEGACTTSRLGRSQQRYRAPILSGGLPTGMRHHHGDKWRGASMLDRVPIHRGSNFRFLVYRALRGGVPLMMSKLLQKKTIAPTSPVMWSTASRKTNHPREGTGVRPHLIESIRRLTPRSANTSPAC
jgi:hypothetical protein